MLKGSHGEIYLFRILSYLEGNCILSYTKTLSGLSRHRSGFGDSNGINVVFRKKEELM